MRLNLCVKLHATLKPKHKPKFVRIANSEIILPNFVYQVAHWCKYHDMVCLSKTRERTFEINMRSNPRSTLTAGSLTKLLHDFGLHLLFVVDLTAFVLSTIIRLSYKVSIHVL